MNKQETIEFIQNKIYRVLDKYDLSVVDAFIEYYGEDENKLDKAFVQELVNECFHYDEENDYTEVNYPDELVFVTPTLHGKFLKYEWHGVEVMKPWH